MKKCFNFTFHNNEEPDSLRQMNLSVDIGNTFIKAALFKEDELIKFFSKISEKELLRLIQEYKPEAAILSSVSGKKEEVLSRFPTGLEVFWMSPQTRLPFFNNYKTPETLGMDRLAAVAGARVLYPNADRLVIDAGTCITYEFIDQQDSYEGGMIAPGIEMRFKALNTFTSRLPLISRSNLFDLTGKTTEESIRAGVLKGILAETSGIINEFEQKYPGIKVILCGGDAPFFESKLKEHIFAVPELVLIGLNSILLYNVSIR